MPRDTPRSPPPTVEDLFDALADVYDANAGVALAQADAAEKNNELATLLDRWRTRPVTMTVLINGKKDNMPINIPDDKPFKIHVVFDDKFGDEVGEPGPTTFKSSDETLVTVGPDPDHPDDDTYAEGTPQAGSGTVTVEADSGNLTGTSDSLVITGGTATAAHVEINMAPKAQARSHKK